MKLFFLLLLIPSLSLAFPTNAVIDDFNRADSNPIDGIWTNDVFAADGCQLTSETLRKEGSGSNNGCYVTASIASTDREVFATLPNATNHSGSTNFSLLVCIVGGVGSANADGYGVMFRKITGDTDQLRINRIDNAVFTQIGSNILQEVDDGDKLGAEHFVAGDLINLWFKDGGGGWTQLGSESGSSVYNCTNAHVGVVVANTSHWVDDFGSGDFSVVGGGDASDFQVLEFK
jgi:hypothetical protein